MRFCRRYKPRWLVVALVTLTCSVGMVSQLLAQSDDSVYHRFNPAWTRYYFLNDVDRSEVIDTTIDFFHRYHPGFNEFNESHTGNLGLASFRLSPQLDQRVGYRIGIDAYDEYMFTPENTPFYSTRRPYTSLNYLLGTKNEQMFSGTHTQNITRQYNFNFRFLRIGSQGTFARQRADWFNLGLGQSFVTKDQRYFIQALVHQNRSTLQQNGGIAVNLDSAYSQGYFDRNLVPVRLDSAFVYLRERSAFVQHGLQWGGYFERKVDTLVTRILYPTVRLQHRFQFSRLKYLFHDDAVDFGNYDNVFINAEKTNDSKLFDVWRNELRLELTDIKSQTDSTTSYKPFAGSVGAAHELWNIFDPTTSDFAETKSNVVLKGDARTNLMSTLQPANPLRNVDLRINGAFGMTGENEGDYAGTLQAGYRFGPVIPIFIFRRSLQSPTRFEEFYQGNHFQWNNAFDKTTINIFGGLLYFDRLKGFIGYHAYQVTNPVYFDATKRPAQLLGTVNGYSFSVAPNITFGNFHFDAHLVWQSYDHVVLNYPDFYSTASLYYRGNLFKKALLMAAGVEGRYNTAYNAPGFEPNTSQFYLQNDVETGDYVWLDAFVNLKIRSVRVALIGQNLLQGMSDVNTFGAVPYPMPDRSFKLRIDWMFWN